jgi:hypothetical protein
MTSPKLRLAKGAEPSTALDRAMGDRLSTVRARGGSPRTEHFYAAILWQVLLPWATAEDITKPRILEPED